MVNLPFFKKTDKSDSKFLTLSISSSDVKCLAFYCDGEKYKIIGVGEAKLEPGNVRNNIIIDEDEVTQKVNSAVNKALENFEEEITNVIWDIKSELSMGISTTVRFHRDTKEAITSRELENLYQKITETAQIQIQNEYLQTTGDPDPELEIITSSNIYTKVDNQPVQEVEGTEGSLLETAVFNSFAPGFHLKTIEKICRKNGLNLIAIGPELYTITQQILNINPQDKDFVLVNITHDSTDVAIIFGEGIVSTKSLGIGYIHFVEGLASKMGLTNAEAKKVLESYISQSLTDSESMIVKKCIKDVIELWIIGLQLLFGEFTGVKTFASKIYLTGKGSRIKDLINNVETQPWSKDIQFKESPKFSIFGFNDLVNIGDSTGLVENDDWFGSASLSIIHKEMFGTY